MKRENVRMQKRRVERCRGHGHGQEARLGRAESWPWLGEGWVVQEAAEGTGAVGCAGGAGNLWESSFSVKE